MRKGSPDEIWADRVHMEGALKAAEESRCAKRKVGAVVIRGGNILSEACNGTPSGDTDCVERMGGPVETEEGKGRHKEFSPLFEIHAEQAAVAKAARKGFTSAPREKGAGRNTLLECHCTLIPCLPCTYALVEAGVDRIVYLEDRSDVAEEHEKADLRKRLEEIGVELVGPTEGTERDPSIPRSTP